MSQKTRRGRRGPVLVLVTLLLLVAGGYVLWARAGSTAPGTSGTAAPTTPGSGTTGAAPSTGAAGGEETAVPGDGAVDPEPSSPVSPTADAPEPVTEEAGRAGAVAVSLTYTGYDPSTSAVVAGGYAADVVEVDATCTLVLSRDGVELRGESLGTPSATTTDCGEVRVGGDALTPGTWQAVLSYTSDTSAGQSAAVEVLVP